MHLLLAFRAFWAALFGRPLPTELLPAALPQVAAPAIAPAMERPAPKPEAPIVPAAKTGPSPEAIAARTLSIFQSEGRLLDFLGEDIASYADADVGAAVREVHRGCKKALKDHFDLVPVQDGEEEARVDVAVGFDPAKIRLVGNVVGQPPFKGTLKHKGWMAKAVRLPKIPDGEGAMVIAPAEIEL